MLQWFPNKDPADIDYYSAVIDQEWLQGSDIDTATVEPEAGSELIASDITITGNKVVARFSGGVPGTHKVEVTITSNGRTRQRTIYLVVEEL